MEFKFLKKMGVWISTPFYYRKVRKMGKPGEHLIILVPAYGDTCYGMLYAKELKKETGKKLTILCCDKFKKVVEEYGCADKIITYGSDLVSKTRIFSLVGFNSFFGSYKTNDLIITCPDPKGFPGLTVKEAYRDILFKVKHDNFQLYRPKNPPKVTAIENFEANKDKIVVFNSYSNSYCKDAKKYLQKVANSLAKKGYILYSNVVGKQKPLEKTQPLFCSPDELFSICESCRAFVSVRSGIVDFLLSTKCRKFVVYVKNKKFRFAHSLKYYNLDNIEELYVGKESQITTLVNAVNDFVCKK